jgi:hypothetical protein
MIKMKCALELTVIKEVAETQYQEEQRIRAEQVAQRTIQYAEEVIGVALEERAKNRQNLVFIFKARHLNWNPKDTEVCPLYSQGRLYANGTESFSSHTEESISLPLLKNYLESHCLEMTISDSSFMTYGCGCRDCVEIRVSVN